MALARAARVSVDRLAHGAGSAHAVTRAVEHGDFIFMPRNSIRFSSGRDGILRSEQVVDSIAFRADWVKRALHTESRDLILIEVIGDSMAPLSRIRIDPCEPGEPRFTGRRSYLLLHYGGLAVKRIQRRPDGKLWRAATIRNMKRWWFRM